MKKFKKIKNVLKVLGTIVMILILNTLSLANSVYAAELGTSANLENLGSLLKYKGNTVITTYVSYNDGQNKYPAYCLNANLPGVGENGNYTVSTNNLITDVKLWRLVVNGYPYKTIGELGCANKEEAFTATKHAIYSYIHGNNPNDYTAIGEAGVRTLKALKQIVTNANNSTEVKVGSNITIQAKEGLFKQDSIEVQKMIDCSKTKDYFSEKRRMIKKHKYICKLNCDDCPLGWSKNGKGISCETLEKSYPEKAIEIVQKWSDKHPQKTYLSELLKAFPNAQLNNSGMPKGMCPHELGLKDIDCGKTDNACVKCWNQPLPIEDGEEQ